MKFFKYITAGVLAMSLYSCSSDFLETEDTEYLDATAAGEAAAQNPDVFLNGMWSYMVEYQGYHDSFGFMSTLLACDMQSEDIACSANHWFIYDYQMDNRAYDYRRTQGNWVLFYTEISKANEVLSLYPNRDKLSDAEKALVGQALAVRGMSYYYLIQLFQNCTKADGKIDTEAKGVPLMLLECDGYTADELDALKSRNTVGRVFEAIESDLTTAATMLEECGYERPSKNYIDASVANGLLARYYLLSQQWAKAASTAAKARAGYPIMDKDGLYDGFMAIENSEWMWGFKHTSETQTTYASYFSHISNLAPGYAGIGYMPKHIDARLYSYIPENDYRKAWFNGPEGAKQATAAASLPYANVKFGNDGNWTMNYLYMRAAEMVLIQAEAEARQGHTDKAATVLKDLMSKRVPGWNESEANVQEIILQRRIELWGEGFAYFDLKRQYKGIDRNYEGNNHLAGYEIAVPAGDPRWMYQIPRSEMQENKHLTEEDQNP